MKRSIALLSLASAFLNVGAQWVTNPNFTQVNRGYDIARDAAGNVYVYGGSAPYQLKKFNPTGVMVWSYTANPLFNSTGPNYYGDMGLDSQGSEYISSGCCNSYIVKVNNLGTMVWTSPNPYLQQWRMAFRCDIQSMIVGGNLGSNCNPNPCNIASFDPLTGLLSNVTNVQGNTTRSLALMTNNRVYSLHVTPGTTPSAASNVLTCSVLPNFTPVWSVPSNYLLSEADCGYAAYTTNGSGGLAYGYHGINAIAGNSSWIYTYDGATIYKRNAANGAPAGMVAVAGGQGCLNSGIAVDVCGNVYVGTQNGISKYDSTLAFVNAVNTPGAVYDLVIGLSNNVFACGNGFVASLVGLSPCATSCLATGVPEENESTLFDIAPNPSSGNFSIHLRQALVNPSIVIYNALGQKVFSQFLATDSELDLSAQPKGVYFYRISGPGRNTYSGKLLIQ